MRQPRGFMLLYGLVILAVMLAAVMLLAYAANARRQSQRSMALRNTALANAESALEQARAQLASGKLAPGMSITVDGCSVACATVKNAVQLNTLVQLDAGGQKTTAAHPQDAVRVRWTLTETNGNQWSVSEWHVQNETLR
jgi:Tfp pilus assembly protein PilX